METAQQNGSLWLRSCQPTYRNSVQGKISNHWFPVKALRVWGKVAKMRHQLLSAGSPLWRSTQTEQKQIKSVGLRKEKWHRNQQMRGNSDCFGHLPSLWFNRFLFTVHEFSFHLYILSICFLQSALINCHQNNAYDRRSDFYCRIIAFRTFVLKYTKKRFAL